MPIPVNTHHNNDTPSASQDSCEPPCTFTIQIVFIQVIEAILSSRLGVVTNSIQGYCLVDHQNCCFKSTVINENDTTACVVVNIIEKQANFLLERWMMSFDVIKGQENSNEEGPRFVDSVSSFIRQMPAKNDCIEMYSIAFLNDKDTNHCHSFLSTQDRIEFRSDSHLKAQRFHLPSLSLEVVYDNNASQYYTKKPMISLQSLSNPSFMSWSKSQQQQSQQEENVHPLSVQSSSAIMTTPNLTNSNNSSTVPVIAVRRLSRLSLSAIQFEDNYDTMDDESDTLMSTSATATSTTIPIPSSRMQYTHHGHYISHRSTIAFSSSPKSSPSFSSLLSPTEYYASPLQVPFHPQQRRSSLTGDLHHGCLVGSFEESLLSGRMSSMPSKPITFHCQIGVLGYGDCKPSLKCPPHWSIVFPAMFYKLGEEEEKSTPYVGTVDIGEHVKTVIQKSNIPGYRIPPKGQLQFVVKNPNKTAVKLFLVPYDFTDMPKNTKTFLRQKSYTIDTPQQLLRYAIHLQICRTEKKRIYLYKSIRIVFSNRTADAREKFKVLCEGPNEPCYMPL